MTEYKIIGIAEKEGNYQGNAYHNMVLNCVSSTDSKDVIGEVVSTFKIKWHNVPQAFGLGTSAYKLTDFINLVGKKAFIYFDRYGTATEVRVCKDDKSEKHDNKTA